MSDKRVSLDTNILIYAIDKDAGHKQITAIQLIEKCALEYDTVLTLQSLSEFYFAATRKNIVMHSEAEAQIKDWQLLFPTLLPSTHTVNYALTAVAEYKLSFWDAMLWSVARENNVNELYSEDFQSGRELNGVTFINPFT
jgi:predicted nucleic acid-binding protein